MTSPFCVHPVRSMLRFQRKRVLLSSWAWLFCFCTLQLSKYFPVTSASCGEMAAWTRFRQQTSGGWLNTLKTQIVLCIECIGGEPSGHRSSYFANSRTTDASELGQTKFMSVQMGELTLTPGWTEFTVTPCPTNKKKHSLKERMRSKLDKLLLLFLTSKTPTQLLRKQDKSKFTVFVSAQFGVDFRSVTFSLKIYGTVWISPGSPVTGKTKLTCLVKFNPPTRNRCETEVTLTTRLGADWMRRRESRYVKRKWPK